MKSHPDVFDGEGDAMTPRSHTWRHDKAMAYLFVPYSPKLFRRVKLYGHELYDFWAEFEFDPTLRDLNELPHPLAWKDKAGGTSLSLSAIVEARNGRHEGVVLTSDIKVTSARLDQFEEAAESAGLHLTPILLPSLRHGRLLRENRHRMLRFLALYGNSVRSDFVEQLCESIEKTPSGISVSALQNVHSCIDRSICVAAIVKLVIEGRANAAIETRPFNRFSAITSAGSSQ